MRKTLILIPFAILAMTMACCCCCGAPTNFEDFENWDFFDEFEFEFETPVSEPSPEPVVTREPVPDAAAETAELLRNTVIPVRDLHELAIRLMGLPADTPNTINPSGSPDYAIGTRRTFRVSNVDTDEQFDVDAILEYKTEHVYMWVEQGVRFDRDDLIAAADLFEEETYATNRTFFGSEWSPGVDNDPHVSILHASGLGSSVAGYYSSADEFVAAVREDSNEMEMFYIQMDNVTINSSFYNGVLAHEFQHMIHWYNDRNEDTWLNEGFSELAMFLNNFDVGGSDYTFARTPDTQLNAWPEGPGAAGANYGAAYLFTSYFLDQFGPDASQDLVGHDENGFAAVDAVLDDLGSDLSHIDFFANWVVANLLDQPNLGDGQYGYDTINPPDPTIDITHDAFPISRSSTVHQYATDYIEVQADQPLQFSFTGSTLVGLFDAQAHSGDYLWWSNRGDDSNMMLTQSFDLSNVSEATLEYWCWYDIEVDWDYTYVEVSTDEGQTWTILRTPSGTDTNPNGNSFGWGYTGESGGWIQERVDLSPYAGQDVLVRFEYITDDAVNRPGFALDDVSIPEIGYFSDLEDGDGGWEPAGFIRHANVLPQRWIVQVVTFGAQTSVERMELDAEQTGSWQIPLGNGVRRAIIVITAYAPVTTEPASYHYEIK
ncbi:MAG: immune inhibitor A [Anaerolineae bacterium]|nr:immune inhibitor A [Anaerolineae bacterium]